MQPTRLHYIDSIKAICIFLMVVGHWNTNELVERYVYSFHIPAFFIISGFLYKRHTWWQTILSFAIPVIVFSMIRLAVMILLGELSLQTVTISYVISHTLGYRYGLGVHLFEGIWFLWALLVLRLLFGDVNMLSKLRASYTPLAIAVIVYMTFESHLIKIDTLFRGYYIGRAIPCLPFFCLGLYLKDRNWNPNQRAKPWFVIPVTLICISMPILNGRCDLYGNDYGYSYLLASANAALATLLLCWLTSKFPPIKCIETISRGTLVVLGCHMPILHVLDYFLPDCLRDIFPVITIILCYYIIIICERFFPALLGKITTNKVGGPH